MTYATNRTQQLVDAHNRGRFGQKASLQAAGVPLPQHNSGAKKLLTKKAAAKKPASAKKSVSVKKPAAVKKDTKRVTKKATAKKATTKKS